MFSQKKMYSYSAKLQFNEQKAAGEDKVAYHKYSPHSGRSLQVQTVGTNFKKEIVLNNVSRETSWSLRKLYLYSTFKVPQFKIIEKFTGMLNVQMLWIGKLLKNLNFARTKKSRLYIYIQNINSYCRSKV